MKKDTVILDIDGVLADYRTGLLQWINKNLPELQKLTEHHLGRNDTWVDYKSMGISYREWLQVLETFRMSRGKVFIPTFDWADTFTQVMRAEGYFIVLLTSRPIDIYSNIYLDTVQWLQKNNLDYDLLLWCRNKSEMIFRNGLIDRTLFAVDDELRHIQEYSALGMKTYWIDHYKANSQCMDRCVRVSCLKDILSDMNIHVEVKHKAKVEIVKNAEDITKQA